MRCVGASTPLGFWGPGQGVRGLGVRGDNTGVFVGRHRLTPLGFWGPGQGVRGLGVRGDSGHGSMDIGADWSMDIGADSHL